MEFSYEAEMDRFQTELVSRIILCDAQKTISIDIMYEYRIFTF